MKIFWQKIPKCFTHVALTDDNVTLWAFIYCPKRWEDTHQIGLWIPQDSLRTIRVLIKDEEYELDGTEDWKTSLQERPEECKPCRGTGFIKSDSVDMGGKMPPIRYCAICHGTGLKPPPKCTVCKGDDVVKNKKEAE